MSLIHDTSTAIQALRQLETFGIAAMICDSTGIIQLMNNAAAALFSEEPSYLEGQNINELDAFEPLRPMLGSERPQISPQLVLLYNHLHCYVRMQRIGRVGYVFTFEDVSELKQNADRQATALDTVAHDLKAPISAVKAFADLVRNSGNLNDKQSGFINRIFTAVGNMEGFVRDLLDITWLDADKPLNIETVHMAEVLQRSLTILSNHQEKRQITINIDVPENLTSIDGDGRRLERMMINLISNAIKYTEIGGTVNISIAVDSPWQVIEVADTGVGIPQDALPHIFKRFYRVPRDNDTVDKVDGTGLGLSIVKTIVDRHHGDVSAISEVGKGSVFTVRLLEKQPTSESAES